MITFNGVEPPQQPSDLNENPSKVKTDTNAIDGTPSRVQFPSKGYAKLVFPKAKPETYQFFKALYDAAASVTYRNDKSNVTTGVLEFSGIIDVNEDDYLRGGSLRVPLTVTMQEGQIYEV